MKDISLSRHYLPALVFTSLLALLPFSAGAKPEAVAPTSPYVGTASAKEMYRQYAIQQRRTEAHGSADSLATSLARVRTPHAAAMSRLHATAASTADTVSSTVQTEDYTLPLEDVDAQGNDIAPTSLSNTGANIDPAWFPDESFIAYSSNHTSDGLYHIFALPATGIDTSVAGTQTERQAQVSQMTSDTTAAPHNERWASFVSPTQIAYCQSYGASANGPYSLIIAQVITSTSSGVNLPIVNQANAGVVIQVDPTSTTTGAIASVEHPVYAGDAVIFSAILNGQSVYHIFKYTISTKTITQITSGFADEENPSVVTLNNQSVIVFDSNASSAGYTLNTSNLGYQTEAASAQSATGQRNIFAISSSGTGAVQVTNSTTASSLEPSLGDVTAAQAAGIGEGVHLFFSSNRIGGHYNIYDLALTITANGTPAVTGTEASGNTANIILTSDPQATDTSATPAPVGNFDNLEPAAPPFTNFNTVLFVSPRYLVNNLDDNPVSNGALRYGATLAPLQTTDFEGDPADTEMQPTNTAIPGTNGFAAAGTLPANSQTLAPTGSFEVLSSHDADIDPPSLLRFNDNEIIHITTSDNYQAADVRQPGAGQTIYFFVRLSDRQTGVGPAYLQIKDPNSAFQDPYHNEHKVYTKDPGIVLPSTDNFLHPTFETGNAFNPVFGNEATRLYDAGGGGAVGGFSGGGATSTPAPNYPIELGNLRLSTPLGYTKPDTNKNLLTGYTPTAYDPAGDYIGGPIASFTSAAAPNETTLMITGENFLETIYQKLPQVVTDPNTGAMSVQGIPYPLPLNDYGVAGCTLDLYSGTGVYQETVQVTNVNYPPATASPAPATLTVTPLRNSYTTAPTGPVPGTATGTPGLYGPPKVSAGYAVIDQVGYYDPEGVEVDAEAIQPYAMNGNTQTQIDASNPASFTIPQYIPGLDDLAPYSGQPEPSDPVSGNPEWITLKPIVDDKNGGIIYEGTWQTPGLPSDWYVDTITYDNALNDISNTTGAGDKAVNWRIYDNVWGFSTLAFVKSTNPGDILLVNDYMLPQKFLSQGIAAGNAPVSYFGAESYLTGIDTNPQSAGNNQQLAALPDAGLSIQPNTTTLNETLSLIYHRPAEAGLSTSTSGLSNAPNYPNTLGPNSYIDGDEANIATLPAETPTFPIQSTSDDPYSIVTGNVYLNTATNPPTAQYTTDPPEQDYDLWRILCRGPIPATVVNQYSPTVFQQRADLTNDQASKNVLVSPSCIIWSSPVAGDEFADSGTIADPFHRAASQRLRKTAVWWTTFNSKAADDFSWKVLPSVSLPARIPPFIPVCLARLIPTRQTRPMARLRSLVRAIIPTIFRTTPLSTTQATTSIGIRSRVTATTSSPPVPAMSISIQTLPTNRLLRPLSLRSTKRS